MVRSLKELLRRGETEDQVEVEPRHEQCLSCGAELDGSRSYERYRVCHSCGFHFHLSARERIATLLDMGSFHEDDRSVTSIDPISFSGRQSYRSRVINAQRRTGLAESALTGTGMIFGREVVVAVIDFSFLGGSIGVVAGERLARAFEKAASRRVPLITIASTSGTRMQEGMLALMQIPRVLAASRRHEATGQPHIAVLTDPTTGSGYAGFLNLADMVIAEPNALVGYAALRVLQESEEGLPAGSHTSESHLSHGLIDAIVPRPQLRDSLGLLLDMLLNDYRLTTPRDREDGRTIHTQRGAWQQVQISRHQMRPTAMDLIGRMTSNFVALHGDRQGSDDPSVAAGFATLGGEAVVLIGQVRPHETSSNGDGWIGPGGFRKATRAMKLAAKLRLPVVTLIDTAGAYPGLDSEEAGLGHAIAECMATMLDLPVPTIAVITGEGSSEGALAMAVADRVLMLDNAVYEVIRPEDAAKILFQDTGETAERLRLTSHDCLKLGIIDGTVPEPGDGAHTNHEEAALLIRRSIRRELIRLQRMRPRTRLDRRYERYREIGSTRSWVRGTMERRIAHLVDRIGGAIGRIRGRSSYLRRRVEFGDHPEIPL